MFFDDKHVKIHGCFVVWDGITRPDQNPDGSPKYTLKVVVDPNNPDLKDMEQLANTSLQQSKFKGVLPAGGLMPIGQARPDEFNGMYTGWAVLACKSKFMPDVYDENGQKLDPMQYGAMLYGGQQVDILVHCYEYDKAGNRGISAGLDGFAIIASANAPQQSFGGGGVNTASAFGGGAPQAAPAAQPGYQQPQAAPAAQPGYQQPQAAPAAQPGYQQPQAAPAAQPGYQQPQAAPAAQPQAAPAAQPGQYPQQAQNFMPQ